MNISLLQLNINADNYWDQLISFLESHNFDIIHFQEVCSKDMICGNISCKRDCYQQLQKILSTRYDSAFSITQHYSSSPQAIMGNATFYKKQFTLKKQMSLPIFINSTPIPPTQKTFENVGRVLLAIELVIENKPITFLNTHLAWAHTPQEEPHQTKQGEVLLSYLEKISHPFVLSGDFNLSPDQPLINKINKLARNLSQENNIINTLNPRLHRADVFPPGIAVDYIFVTPDIKVNKFTLLDHEDLSDHLGMTVEITV